MDLKPPRTEDDTPTPGKITPSFPPQTHQNDASTPVTAPGAGIVLKGYHLVLFLATPVALTVLTLLVPTVKESVLSLFHTSTFTEAYIGDGILIGDAGTNIPFSTVNWKVSQVPNYGNSYHTLSIFVVPERVARRHLYPYYSYFDSETYDQVTRDADSQSIAMRSYIYLLPKIYLRHRKDAEAKVEYHASIKADMDSEPLGTMIYQYQNREYFSDFIDKEPGAYEKAMGCKCDLGEAIAHRCPDNDKKCIERVKEDSACPLACFENGPYFIADTSSYNFFSIVVPPNYYVKYNVSIEMYFYNHTMFRNYFVCTIRGNDSCPFTTPGYLRGTKLWQKRDVVIAYVHPTTVPGSFTTRLLVEAEVQMNYIPMLAFLCAILTAYLVLKYCRKMHKWYQG